jgi:catechol 2,3-dioxygenase
MLVQQLGHVVLKVRDLQRSEAFYAGVLGMQIISQSSEPVAMTFFTLGNHHDFAVIEIGDDAPSPDPDATGLAHVAFKVGNSPDELRGVEAELNSAGVAVLYKADRAFTKRVHVADPDGHEVELYIDTSDAWKIGLRGQENARANIPPHGVPPIAAIEDAERPARTTGRTGGRSTSA